MISWNETGLSLAAGSLSTLSPCVFPLLPLVLGGAAQRHRAAPLAMALGHFGAGAALPLVGVAYLSRAGFLRMQSWLVLHADQGKKAFGIVLLLVGLAILSGADHWLDGRVNDWLPDAWLALTVRL